MSNMQRKEKNKGKEMKEQSISEFFDNEYKQQAQNDNFARISSIFGFKPTANKVLNTMLSKNINTWQKVEVVSNVTALETLYMGGSSNIDSVTVNICTDYVGSSNLPLLDTKGDFGARLDKSAAASRYIFTRLHDNLDMVFNKIDLKVLPRYNFEDQDIEYKYLSFTIPMLLVNGSEGMGTGHAQKIFPRSVKNVKDYIIAHLNKKPLPDLPVHYNGYLGKVYRGSVDNQWATEGLIKRKNSTSLEILEVPIGENYRSYIKTLDKLVDDDVIRSYKDLCDPKSDTFNFVIKHSIEFGKLSDEQILSTLKLITTDVENFTVIDENNSVRIHTCAEDVINHYIELKMQILQDRKDYMIQDMKDKIAKDESRYEFIRRIVEDELVINKRKKTEIVKDIEPVEKIIKIDGNYDYLLNMAISTLTEERMISLIKDIKKNQAELAKIQKTTTKTMWLEDLKKIKD